MQRPSWFHITTRSSFLALALFLGLALYYLPSLLWLDRFRPQVIEALEKTFNGNAIVGTITGELLPQPALVVGHVVLQDSSHPPRVLASASAVRLILSADVLRGHLRFKAIRFWRPRFILHRDPYSEPHWVFLRLPGERVVVGPVPKEAVPVVSQWQVRAGRIEIWDHATRPSKRWTAEGFNGTFSMTDHTGSLTGQPGTLGQHAVIDLRYQGSSAFPFAVGLKHVELKAAQQIAHVSIPALEGTVDVQLKIRLRPQLAIEAMTDPMALNRAGGALLRVSAVFEDDHLSARLQGGTTQPMTATVEEDFGKRGWKLHSTVSNYDPRIVKQFYRQGWIDRLQGPGTIDADIQSGLGLNSWRWSALGRHFALEGSAINLPEWSAQGDAAHTTVYAHAETAQGGLAEITWGRTADKKSTMEMTISSVTIAQALAALTWRTKAGFEPWLITQGYMKVFIRDRAMEIHESDWDFLGMHLSLKGTFDLDGSSEPARGRVEGTLENVPMAIVGESFLKNGSPVTGEGQFHFNLNFPLSADWLRGLTGNIQAEIDDGVIRSLKTVYRVVSVLNLSNYLHLRMPEISAQGIVFNSIKGLLLFQNGVLTTEDLFLKSPNMNVGAKGKLDLPGRSVDATLRLEMFRFLEDILRDVPITHWIFKKPNKIFLPLVVHLVGPWDNMDVR